MKKRVAIDLVPIRVGEGGTGSGIWTYARELIHHMDQQEMSGMDVVCLVNAGQLPFLSDLQQVRLVKFPGFGKNIVLRLLWIHLFLPLVCLFHRVDVLHKLATETPLFCPAKRVTTVCDFYYEYLLENHPPETIRLYERLENLYFSFTTRTCFKKSKSIIAISDATKKEAMQRYPDAAERISVIHLSSSHCPVDSVGCKRTQGKQRDEVVVRGENLATKNQELRTNISSFTILCVAKFMEHKGQHVLVSAFDALLDQTPEWVGSVQLMLRGFHNDGEYYDSLCRQVSGSRFSEYIQMVEFNPADRLEEIYHDADLVVLLSNYEGFGLPVLEAQGMGVPVLCSNLPVLREVGGEGAAYVGREDRQDIVDALHRFMADVEYRDGMRVKATENLKRFSWERAAMETIRCYEGVCS